MEIFHGSDFKLSEGCVVAFGKFDGMHEGHCLVVSELCKVAKERGLKSVVYTFDRNPRAFLSGVEFSHLISVEEKNRRLEELGVDCVVYERFDEKFSQILPEDFVCDVLLGRLCAKGVVMGSNSTFGRDGAGDVFLMRNLGEKYHFFVKEVKLLYKEGKLVSSTNLRRDNLSKLG